MKKMKATAFFAAVAALGLLIFLEVISSLKSETEERDASQISFHQMAPPATEKTGRHYQGIGYIMATDYSDQLAGGLGAANLVSLQCWAATVSPQIRVVEPYLLEGSRLGFDLKSDENNLVSLGAVLDADSRDKQAHEEGYVPLIDYDSFIEFAPEYLILVSGCSVFDHSICSLQKKSFYEAAMNFAHRESFDVVRRVHLLTGHAYTEKEFAELIYGTQDPSNSVVLFVHWSGITSGTPVTLESCERQNYKSWLQTSRQIIQDAQHYREQHNMHSKLYVSVVFSSEQFELGHNFDERERQLSLAKDCVDEISGYVESLKVKLGIKNVFLAMDIRERKNTPSWPIVEVMASMLYKELNEGALEEWDDSFDKIAAFKDAGYIAQLQQYLVADSICIVTAGEGAFKAHAKALYNELHPPNTRMHCSTDIPKCLAS